MRWVRRELVADSYGTARVFIAGDAAHLMSPTGGFGMNTGIQDAVDLGWKLEACVRGWGGRELLRSYEVERRPVAVRNVGEASSNLGRMLSTRSRKPPARNFCARPGRRRPRGRTTANGSRRPCGMNGSPSDFISGYRLRRLADHLAGRHPGAAARDLDLRPDRAARRPRAPCLHARRALHARSVRPRLVLLRLGLTRRAAKASAQQRLRLTCRSM